MTLPNKSFILPYVLPFIFFFFTGCNDDLGTDPPVEGESYFEASVSGDLTRQYVGSAVFGMFTDPESEDRGIHIELISDIAFEVQGFAFTGKLDGVPEPKSYSIMEFPSLVDNDDNPFADLEPETFFGLFAPGVDGTHSELFASSDGYLDILESTETQLTGEFSFTAFGYKLDDITDTVWVDIEGEFEAIMVEF